ncbi:MAG: tRNA lysidine(34) synthetase TilS [Candidatus Gracilibacteria bacterium]|jgi:tRNA(Ile)-lysidine synthase
MTENEFEKNLDTYLKNGSTMIVGVSGGPDSIYLLKRLFDYSQNHQLKIIVAHVNHGLRGKENQIEEKFVQNLAIKYEFPFESIKLHLKTLHGKKPTPPATKKETSFVAKSQKNGETNGNLEEIARQKRYAFFEKLRQKYDADYVIVAHHLNDNIETALFNLIRGASFQGIKGMKMYNHQTHILRPLLKITKKEILDFLKKNKLKSHFDESNKDLRFSRNLLRQKAIPLFNKINSGFEKTFQENLQNFTEIAEFIEEKSTTWLQKNLQDQRFPLTKFLELPSFLQKNILVQLYQTTYGSTNKLTLQQLQEILKVLKLQKSNRKKEFGTRFFIQVIKKNESSPREVELKLKPLKKA